MNRQVNIHPSGAHDTKARPQNNGGVQYPLNRAVPTITCALNQAHLAPRAVPRAPGPSGRRHQRAASHTLKPTNVPTLSSRGGPRCYSACGT